MDWLARLHPHAAQAASAARPVLPSRFADAGPAPLRPQAHAGQARLDAPPDAPLLPPAPGAETATGATAGPLRWASAAPARGDSADVQGGALAAAPGAVVATRASAGSAPVTPPLGPTSDGSLPGHAARTTHPTATLAQPLGTVAPSGPFARPPHPTASAASQPTAHLPEGRLAAEASPRLAARAIVPAAPLQQVLPLAAGPAAAASDTPWVVQVHIQHLAVQAPATTARRPAPAPRTAPVAGVSLADYLRGHGPGRRERT